MTKEVAGILEPGYCISLAWLMMDSFSGEEGPNHRLSEAP